MDEPRPHPCASCPYRRDVPSGVWTAEEYDKLITYDGQIHEQAMRGAIAAFGCHQADGHLCSGWVAHREHPSELLAIRLGLLNGSVDESTLDYTTDVALWRSGAEAAAHGKWRIEHPDDRARAVMRKVTQVRAVRGQPVQLDPNANPGTVSPNG